MHQTKIMELLRELAYFIPRKIAKISYEKYVLLIKSVIGSGQRNCIYLQCTVKADV